MKKTFGIAALLYWVLSAILFGYVQFYADNPDTFQYIVIAKKYSAFDFQNAVNGYWSPLISWLLIIPNIFFNDPILAFKLLNLLIGFFVLYEWHLLVHSTNIQESFKKLLVFISIPFWLDYALLNLTPDLLFTGMLLLTINLFLHGRIGNDKWAAHKAGLAGGFLFLTKAFGFPLFLALSISILFYENRKFKINRSAVVRLYTTFGIISLSWIFILSLHYGELTVSRAARFNNSLNMEMLLGEQPLPILADGFTIPYEGQFSAWESPGDYPYVDLASSHPGIMDRIERNIKSIYYYDFRRQVGFIFVLLLAAMILYRRKELLNEKWKFISLVTIMLMYVGYSLVLVHTRYTWVCTLLIIMLSTFFVQNIFKNNIARIILCSIIFLLAIKKPVKEILFTKDIEVQSSQLFSSLTNPFSTLQKTYQEDFEINSFVKKVNTLSLPEGRLVSTRRKNETRDGYATSLRVANAMNSVYLGQSSVDLDSAQVGKNAKSFVDGHNGKQIKYVLAFDFMTFSDSLLLDSQSGVKLYMLNN